MARGHRLNTSFVLAAVRGLSGLFRAVSAVEPITLSSLSPLVPVPKQQTRFCGRKAKCTRLTLTETIRTIGGWGGGGEPRTSTSNFTQLLSSDSFTFVQCCFTSTETIRTIRDGEPRTASSTFTQLQTSAAIDRTWPLFLRVSHCRENLTCTNNAKRWARLLAAENR